MRRVMLVLATMALAILLAGGVAQAIINGEPDRGAKAHPYVGAYLGKFGGKLFPVCSGTLISPKVFLTAGHCTELEVRKDLPVYISFDPTYKPGASKVVKGTPYLHPNYCSSDKEGCGGLFVRYDVGVVVLDKPVRMATYGALPRAGLVDTLKEGQRLTTVGYGINGYQRIDTEPPLPPQPILLDDRYRATLRLLNTRNPDVGEMFVKTTGINLTGSKGETTCPGDSGGPLFVGNQKTIVGVNSYGIAPLCRGPNYFQRVDLPRVLTWVRSFP